MAIEETFRREFQTRVEEVFDAESARFLMAHLPPVPWPDVATKHDLEVLQLATRHDLEMFQVATRNDIEAFQVATRNDLEAHRVATRRDLELLEVRMDGRFDAMRADVTLLISNQTRTMIFALISAVVAIAALALFR